MTFRRFLLAGLPLLLAPYAHAQVGPQPGTPAPLIGSGVPTTPGIVGQFSVDPGLAIYLYTAASGWITALSSSSTTLTIAAQPASTQIFQRSSATGGANGKGVASVPVGVTLSNPAGMTCEVDDFTTGALVEACTVSGIVAAGTSTLNIPVSARMGWNKIKLTPTGGAAKSTTAMFGVGRLEWMAGQSEAEDMFTSLDLPANTLASQGISPSVYSSQHATFTGQAGTSPVTGPSGTNLTLGWAPIADGTIYNAAGAAELVNNCIADQGVNCGVVGYGYGGAFLSTMIPGGSHNAALHTEMAAAGGRFEAAGLWIGASDAQAGTAGSAFQTELGQYWADFNSANGYQGSVQKFSAFIQPLGSTFTYGTQAQALAIRQAHQAYDLANSINYLSTVETNTVSTTNPEITQNGMMVAADHIHRGWTNDDVGPIMTSVSVSGTALTITTTFSAAASGFFTTGSWWTRFGVFTDSGLTTPIAATAGTVSGNQLILTLASAPSGAVYVLWDKVPNPSGINAAVDMVYDNNNSGVVSQRGRALQQNGVPLHTPLGPQTAITLTGAAFDTASPRFGTGDINGGYGTLPATVIPTTGPFTVEVFFKTSTLPSVTEAFFGGAGLGWFGMNPSGYLTGSCDGGSETAFLGTVSLATGSYHHAVQEWDGSGNCYVLIDGNRVITTTYASLHDASNPTVVGVKSYSTGFGATTFNGALDELVLSNIVQYPGTTYTLPTGPRTGNEPGVFGVWHLDGDGTGVQ